MGLYPLQKDISGRRYRANQIYQHKDMATRRADAIREGGKSAVVSKYKGSYIVYQRNKK